MASLLIHLPPIPILRHFILLLILIQTPPYLSSYNDDRGCTNQLISCGNIKNIGFPFWGEKRPRDCGHPRMQLSCEQEITYITINDFRYKVWEVNPDNHTLRITREDYLEGICQPKFVNTSLDTELYVHDSAYKNLTLFYCANDLPSTTGFLPSCVPNGNYVYPRFEPLPLPNYYASCKTVVVPVPPSLVDTSDVDKIRNAIIDGFVVRWIVGIGECEKCMISAGRVCGGIEWYPNQTCYCRDGPCSNFLPDDKAPQSPPTGKFYRKAVIMWFTKNNTNIKDNCKTTKSTIKRENENVKEAMQKS
ncbi:hypothetical protein JHK85_052630 [Glycine max]|nr:hypothetical protein JHK85_052630 [Glycine max]